LPPAIGRAGISIITLNEPELARFGAELDDAFDLIDLLHGTRMTSDTYARLAQASPTEQLTNGALGEQVAAVATPADL
jgi:hypothetical protein